MCRLRQVRNVYRCGHGETLPDEMIYCENSKCKFSPFHPAACKPPKCQQTCTQYRGFPEQYSPRLNRLCDACAANNAASGR